MSDAAAQALRALLNRVVELVVADETIHKHLEEVIQAYATTAPG